jgi:hypothetical protein
MEWPTALVERAEALIAAICPHVDTNRRRDGVQQYVRDLIARAFHPEQAREARARGAARRRTRMARKRAARARSVRPPLPCSWYGYGA